MGVMPALIERDLAAFGAAVTAIQMLVGTHFAPAQGGVFTSRRVEPWSVSLAEAGAVGIGQSSWGPTGFAFAPSEECRPRDGCGRQGDGRGQGSDLKIVQGRNSGAKISPTGLDLVGS